MFFILDPFVYFGIFDESLEKPECLLFLKSVKDAFTSMIDNFSSAINQRLFPPYSHCFQEEYTPVFHQLLEFDSTSSPARGLKHDHRESLNSVRRKNKGITPLLRDSSSLEELKMKKRFFGEANKDGVEEEGKLDLDRLQRERYSWKKQAMVVLSIDLIICAGLFVIWLWVKKQTMTILDLQFNTSHPHPERKMGFEEELEEPNFTPRLSLFSERFSSVEMEGGGFTPPPHTGATIPFQWELTPGKPRSTGDPPPQTVRSLDLHPRMFSERFSSQEMEGGGFTSPPHTGATIPFQWELTPGKPRSTSHSPPQTVRSLDPPPRMFVNSAIATPTNNGKTKVETVWSPTSVLEGPDSSMNSWSSSGKSKWKMMMMMPLKKMVMCKVTPSPQFRSWSWGSSVDISSRYGGESSPFWSFDDLSNSPDSKSKINKLSRRRSLIFFNKTTYSILESMNQSINQAVPCRR